MATERRNAGGPSAMAAVPASSMKTTRPQERVQRRKGRPRSLLVLLKSLVGLRVRIDLKNDCIIEGVVEEVLHDMDFTLLDACETKPDGKMIRLEEVFVMGKTVLYVHIPDRINITLHLQQYNRMVRQSRDMYKRDKRTAPLTPRDK